MMSVCTNCHAVVPEGAKFCHFCGMPVAAKPDPPAEQSTPAQADPPVEQSTPAQADPPVEQSAPAQADPPVEQSTPAQTDPPAAPPIKKRKSSPLVLSVIAAATAGILVFAGIFSYKLITAPRTIAAAAARTVNKMMNSTALAPLLNGFSKNGYSLTASISGKCYGSPATIEFSGSEDPAKNQFSAVFRVNSGANSASLKAYVDRDGIAVACPALARDAYGIRFNDVSRRLSKSVFAPTGNSAYALDSDLYQQAEEFLTMLGDYACQSTGTFSSALADLYADVCKHFTACIPCKTKATEVTAGSEDFRAKEISYRITPENSTEFLRLLLADLNDPGSPLSTHLTEVLESSLGKALVLALTGDFEKISTSQAVSLIRGGVREAIDTVIYADDWSMTLKGYLYRGCLVKAVIEMETRGESSDIVLDLGKTPEDFKEITLTVHSFDEDVYQYRLRRKESGSTESWSFAALSDGDTSASADFQWDKITSEFSFFASSEYSSSLSVDGQLKLSDKELSMSVEDPGYILEGANLTVILARNAKIDKISDSKDLLEMSERDMDFLSDEIVRNLPDLDDIFFLFE